MAEKWRGKPQGGSGVWGDKDSLFQFIGSGEIVELWGLQLVPTQSEETVCGLGRNQESSAPAGATLPGRLPGKTHRARLVKK